MHGKQVHMIILLNYYFLFENLVLLITIYVYLFLIILINQFISLKSGNMLRLSYYNRNLFMLFYYIG